jgi:hypothetical protein
MALGTSSLFALLGACGSSSNSPQGSNVGGDSGGGSSNGTSGGGTSGGSTSGDAGDEAGLDDGGVPIPVDGGAISFKLDGVLHVFTQDQVSRRTDAGVYLNGIQGRAADARIVFQDPPLGDNVCVDSSFNRVAVSYESFVDPKYVVISANQGGQCSFAVAEVSPRLRGTFTATFLGSSVLTEHSLTDGRFDLIPP